MARGNLRPGTNVEAKYKNGARYYAGVIAKANVDGTYDVEYEDGDSEKRVRSSNIRVKGRTMVSASDDSDSAPARGSARRTVTTEDDSDASLRLRVGARVEARYGGKGKYYPGKITRVNSNGTFDITYDDGDKERGVKSKFIRVKDDGRSARRRSKSPRSRRDSEMDEEGADEVLRIIQRVVNEGVDTGAIADYHEGFELFDKDGDGFISEREFGRGLRNLGLNFTKGEVKKLVERFDKDGNDEIDYKEFVKMLKRKDTGRGSNLERGEKVEARYGGGKKWYAGTIARVRADGTYDVEYDDGDKERELDPKLVRSLDRKRQKERSRSRSSRRGSDSDDGSENDAPLERGDKCEARYGGKDKWYPGKIARVHSDGSYDINYEDGDRERNVKARLVRRPGDKKKKSGRGGFSDEDGAGAILLRGDKCEARYGGKSKWYSGKITRVNSDGTFDVAYDDGDTERRVKAKFVRPTGGRNKKSRRGSDSDDDDQKEFERGDKVEAQFEGGKKFYRGIITRAHKNGTYDINYDDGDNEKKVPASRIRLQKGSKKSRKRNDSDDSGKDEDDELAAIVGKVVEDGMDDGTIDTYRDAFEMFDRDGSGKVSRREFEKALDKLSLDFSRREISKMVKRFDRNGDGEISYTEFVRLVEKGSKTASKKSRKKTRRGRDSDSEDSSGGRRECFSHSRQDLTPLTIIDNHKCVYFCR